jgi:hypothetical protein
MTTRTVDFIPVLPRVRIDRRDQISLVATVLLFLAALAGAAGLRHAVESRTRTYATPAGLVLFYPDRWILDDSEAAKGMVRLTEARPSSYPAQFEARWIAVDPTAPDAVVLASVSNSLALNRGREHVGFKMHGSRPGQVRPDLAGVTYTYVFVDDPVRPFEASLPRVVLGEDRMVRRGGRVYVFSLLASPPDRPRQLPRFDTFVKSARFP